MNGLAKYLNNKASELREINKIVKVTRVSAFNKAVKSGYVAMNLFVRERYALKKKDINEVTRIVKANDIEKPISRLEIKAKGIPLLKFAAKQIGKRVAGKRSKKSKVNSNAGTKATIYVGKRQLFKQAFITTMKHGENVFLRSNNERGSVFALYGTQASSLFSSDKATERLKERTTEQFSNIFIKDLNFKLNQQKNG